MQAMRGQAVVEYAGALVIGFILIASTMSFGVDNLANLFVTIASQVSRFLTGVLNAL